MDSPKSPTGSMRRHGRNISQPLIRRSTKGPLDAPDDPLAETFTSPTTESESRPVASRAATQSSQTSHAVQDSETASRPRTNLDLRFLQDPGIYSALPTDDVAPPFLSSQHQPPPGTPLNELLHGGHFRRAADTAAKELLQSAPDDAEQVLQLLYVRLASLILVSRPDLAAQEAGPLTDLLGRSPQVAADLVPLLPWELRLILVRLQSLATTDGGRRGIMALYALAGEVRGRLKQARIDGEENEQRDWANRLRDLGLRLADALVEMGELETANRHLDGLIDADMDEVTYRKAMLRIRVGDVAGAGRSIDKLEDDATRATLSALLQTADGVVSSWQDLIERHPDDALLANNLAVSMLYAGRITGARQILEQTIAHPTSTAGLLFNLSTVYELCTERAADYKAGLAQTLSDKEPQSASGGWERAGFEFKL